MTARAGEPATAAGQLHPRALDVIEWLITCPSGYLSTLTGTREVFRRMLDLQQSIEAEAADARTAALREVLTKVHKGLSQWDHGEDCGVWQCESCDLVDLPEGHEDGHHDPTHEGCDCGLAVLVSTMVAALAADGAGQEAS